MATSDPFGDLIIKNKTPKDQPQNIDDKKETEIKDIFVKPYDPIKNISAAPVSVPVLSTSTTEIPTATYKLNNLIKEYFYLNWNGPLIYKGPGKLVRIPTLGDGSCFFHAFLHAIFIPYRTGEIKGKKIDRRTLVKAFRHDLAWYLSEKTDPNDDKSPTYYDSLSGGQLKKFVTETGEKEYSLENMRAELLSDSAVCHIYNEFISNLLNWDIYLLDMSKKDVYMTGTDPKLIFKGRDSVIIGYLPGHYELIGVEITEIDGQKNILTGFRPNHPLIQLLSKRIEEKIKP